VEAGDAAADGGHRCAQLDGEKDLDIGPEGEQLVDRGLKESKRNDPSIQSGRSVAGVGSGRGRQPSGLPLTSARWSAAAAVVAAPAEQFVRRRRLS
jgi:hypothetical protein